MIAFLIAAKYMTAAVICNNQISDDDTSLSTMIIYYGAQYVACFLAFNTLIEILAC